MIPNSARVDAPLDRLHHSSRDLRRLAADYPFARITNVPSLPIPISDLSLIIPCRRIGTTQCGDEGVVDELSPTKALACLVI